MSHRAAPDPPPPPLPAQTEGEAPCRPRSKTDLFLSFTWLAMQGFGGVLAVVQRELVEKKRWLTREQFLEDWAVAQIMPGPNVVNLSMMIGGRHFGLAGAMAALGGMLLAPLLVVLLLAALLGGVEGSPAVQGALRGMGAVAAGMMAASGLKLLPALRSNVLGLRLSLALAAATFVAIALLRWRLLWVLLGLGGLGCVWAWRRLGRIARLAQAAGVEARW
ncbi:chromate transporter [Tibeticola sp.]|uniref:chromate transporter n=1 Tax=Tibeticola sp. TaxID=2005368 RepID=UPI0025D1445E|nr:chromate transporter [Tibeticola sp.]